MSIKLAIAIVAICVTAAGVSAQPAPPGPPPSPGGPPGGPMAGRPGGPPGPPGAFSAFTCAAVTKRPNGNWYIDRPTMIDIGGSKNIYGNEEIGPRSIMVNNTYLYDFIEQKCGGAK